uniref:Uncharacterized protein n=1 Tax=Setaria viridis TaxID=4556 RepID=A0A4V6D298_SETVI|nr:hypothetical protein SEVIR_9G516100v2 [Setaria viridis]
MARALCHARNNRTANIRAQQRSASHGTPNTGSASQRNESASPPQVQPPKKRGRKAGSQAKLILPQQGAKVVLIPAGDIKLPLLNTPYKYNTQLGAILKREYLGLVEDKDANDLVIRKRPAIEWADYFLDTELIETNHLQEEADRFLETYLQKRVRDMMYQARVDAVKVYSGVKLKRKRGQDARLNSDDTAQNHGGSRPFIETQQTDMHAAKFGPEKATLLNVYAVMISSMKSVDSTGSSGAIRSRKAQKRLEGCTSRRRGGPRTHGHLAIANGAVRKADVRAAAKERSGLYRDLGKEIPESALQRLSAAQAIVSA